MGTFSGGAIFLEGQKMTGKEFLSEYGKLKSCIRSKKRAALRAAGLDDKSEGDQVR